MRSLPACQFGDEVSVQVKQKADLRLRYSIFLLKV